MQRHPKLLEVVGSAARQSAWALAIEDFLQAMVQLPQKCVDLWQELLQAVFFGGIGLLQFTLSGSSEI